MARTLAGLRSAGWTQGHLDGSRFTGVHHLISDEALGVAPDEVEAAVRSLQAEDPRQWWSSFVDFYTGERRRADLAHSCGLQTLAPEVARSDAAAVAQFESGLRAIAGAIVEGPSAPRAPRKLEDALAALGALVGGVTLARAVGDPTLADAIAQATRSAVAGSRSKASRSPRSAT